MLKIYGVPISVHTRKVIVAARLKQLSFELQPVVPVIPDNPPANWRELSPTGKIPVLQDGDFTLADSAAICAYLERKQPQPSLYPSQAKPYGQALWLEQYAGGTLFHDVVHPLFHEVFVHPKVRGIATDAARVDRVLTGALPDALGYLDKIAGAQFLAGPALSVADLAVVSNLVTMHYIGFALERTRFPRLANLFDRVIRMPEVADVLRAEQPAVSQMGLKSEFLNAVLN
ncbi:MAG TPA: glutathione S-transferase family protein [Burkholderiaceae bacterium]